MDRLAYLKSFGDRRELLKEREKHINNSIQALEAFNKQEGNNRDLINYSHDEAMKASEITIRLYRREF